MSTDVLTSEGDCDCNSSQLDAIGECDGACVVDGDLMASATTWTTALANSTSAASTTDQAPSTSADVLTSLKETAIATATSSMPWAYVRRVADVDADGICDDEDECVGALDECGICNGPGAIYECGCSDIPEGDCDCDGNQLDALACAVVTARGRRCRWHL